MKIHDEIRKLIYHYRALADDIRIDETSERYCEAQVIDNVADDLENLLDRPDIREEQ